jgi:hypothetical protein
MFITEPWLLQKRDQAFIQYMKSLAALPSFLLTDATYRAVISWKKG